MADPEPSQNIALQLGGETKLMLQSVKSKQIESIFHVCNNLVLQVREENFQVIEVQSIRVVWMFKILLPDTVETVSFSGSTTLNFRSLLSVRLMETATVISNIWEQK